MNSIFKGAIICGYPGIGKTTISKNRFLFIDLDSSLFKNDDILWYENYCNMAIKLASDGYYVFVSCHDKVRNYLAELPNNESYDIITVYPDYNLYYEWVIRLKNRFDSSNDYKDFKALSRVQEYFYKDIYKLKQDDRFKRIEIESIEDKWIQKLFISPEESEIMPICDGKMKVFYICDRKKCSNCSNSDCSHTTDIRHATYFISLGDDSWVETPKAIL